MAESENNDRKRSASELSMDDSDDESETEMETTTAKDDDDSTSVRLAVLKREKRLKMNRESAKKRRELQKCRLRELEAQVDQLNKKNHHITMLNESLSGRVQKLESELSVSRSTISFLTNQARQLETSSALMNVLHGRRDAALGGILRQHQGAHLGGAAAAPNAASLRSFESSATMEALLQQNAALRNSVQGIPAAAGLAAPRLRDPARGIHPQSIQNTFPLTNRELGPNETRVDEGTQARLLADALSPQNRHTPSAAAQMLDLLKQQQQKFGPKF